jgi:hypothetical protein
LAAVACGGGDSDAGGRSGLREDDQRPIRRAVTGLYAAAAAQDGERMCRLLAPAWRDRLDRGTANCAAEALRVVLGPGPPRNLHIGRVAIDAERATVAATAVRGHGAGEQSYRHRIELVHIGPRWLVVAATDESR